MTTKPHEDWAKDALRDINSGYDQETLITEGYAYFDDVAYLLQAAEARGYRLAKLERVAEAVKSIDWHENAHDASIYVVTVKRANRLLEALKALDQDSAGGDEK